MHIRISWPLSGAWSNIFPLAPSQKQVFVLHCICKEETGKVNIPESFPVKPRTYQLSIAESALKSNSLIVLPTGLGKTLIAALVVFNYVGETGKAIITAPTRPLVNQHLREFSRYLSCKEDEIVALTGSTKKEGRETLWKTRFVVCTPQTLQNDLNHGITNLRETRCLVIDEAHRAVGNYAYVSISRTFMEESGGRLIGLTASPGSDPSKFQSIKDALGIDNVIIRDENDPEIRAHFSDVKVTVTRIARPEPLKIIQSYCDNMLQDLKKPLRDLDFFIGKKLNRSTLAQSIPAISEAARTVDGSLFRIIPRITACIRLDYALEYLETQGAEMFYEYLDGILESQDKSMIRTADLLRSTSFLGRILDMRQKVLAEEENPKMKIIQRICIETLSANQDSRIIVFTHFRKTSEKLTAFLNSSIPGEIAVRFVGQASRSGSSGLTQKDQESILDAFREGKKKILVATSVAEEGLDIPQTDQVIFYEPVPSDIRSIQRRGRTGRIRAGSVHILTYEGSRDISYLYSSQRKESRMKQMMSSYSNKKGDLYSY
jgi:Fanconi anemia group M protein